MGYSQYQPVHVIEPFARTRYGTRLNIGSCVTRTHTFNTGTIVWTWNWIRKVGTRRDTPCSRLEPAMHIDQTFHCLVSACRWGVVSRHWVAEPPPIRHPPPPGL
jgi:hypothetical protein